MTVRFTSINGYRWIYRHCNFLVMPRQQIDTLTNFPERLCYCDSVYSEVGNRVNNANGVIKAHYPNFMMHLHSCVFIPLYQFTLVSFKIFKQYSFCFKQNLILFKIL